ncbi:hypothetical protein [Spiroplasma endosymbiont of Agriotes lineatus]|uniref:hypothetical protein n=1 Tax=Spiroplasma endosymbiont of Agriotes lineatus TaxID=3077930 RepID=UPI0030CBA079
MKPILVILFILLHLGIIIIFWKWADKEDKKDSKNPEYPNNKNFLKSLLVGICMAWHYLILNLLEI